MQSLCGKIFENRTSSKFRRRFLSNFQKHFKIRANEISLLNIIIIEKGVKI